MIIDTKKLDLCLARKGESISALRYCISPQTLTRIRRKENITPRTLGRLAKALGVDPAELVETEE